MSVLAAHTHQSQPADDSPFDSLEPMTQSVVADDPASLACGYVHQCRVKRRDVHGATDKLLNRVNRADPKMLFPLHQHLGGLQRPPRYRFGRGRGEQETVLE